MNRITEIITNELIVKKHKLEYELEATINSKDTPIDDKVKKVIKLLNKVNKVTNAFTTFESYIKNNNNNT
jgi:hypothetical protein|tara:strand:- start:3175 stop:3384 length:210 start_codon:yes stop_codon:yes gene_type:complete